jgi:hypothetical protein
MDLCLIPPIQHLRQFPQKRHLVLSHLLTDQRYREYYMQRKAEGDFIILDNSAHENGIGEGAGKLLLQALSLMPDELVVPDALENYEQTVEFADNALRSWYGSAGRLRGLPIRLMYVPQGRNVNEWAQCLVELMELHDSSSVSWGVPPLCTIGISKDYAHWPGGLAALLDLVQPIVLEGHEVHLLGSGHDYWTAADLGKRYAIRSVDTAKPFVWAYHGVGMNLHAPHYVFKDPPPRPPLYFYTRFDDLNLAKYNAETLRKLVEG